MYTCYYIGYEFAVGCPRSLHPSPACEQPPTIRHHSALFLIFTVHSIGTRYRQIYLYDGISRYLSIQLRNAHLYLASPRVSRLLVCVAHGDGEESKDQSYILNYRQDNTTRHHTLVIPRTRTSIPLKRKNEKRCTWQSNGHLHSMMQWCSSSCPSTTTLGIIIRDIERRCRRISTRLLVSSHQKYYTHSTSTCNNRAYSQPTRVTRIHIAIECCLLNLLPLFEYIPMPELHAALLLLPIPRTVLRVGAAQSIPCRWIFRNSISHQQQHPRFRCRKDSSDGENCKV